MVKDNEKARTTLKKNQESRSHKRNLDIFHLSRTNTIHQKEPKNKNKYKKTWQKVRLILREKFAKRGFKETEMYERIIKENNSELKRMENFALEMKPTSAEITSKPWYIIHPKSRFSKYWNFQMIVVMFYTATALPYRIAFVDPIEYDTWYFIDNILNLLFFIDLLVNCFTGYYESPDSFKSNFSFIFIRYVKTWLLIDLFSCIPFDLFLQTSGKNYNNLARLLRLPRLYRLSKVSGFFKYLKSRSKPVSKEMKINYNESHLKLFNFFLTVVLCSHIMICLFYFAAKFNDFSRHTWVSKFSYQDASVSEKYFLAMYWAYTTLTTVGYGDIYPCSSLEIVFAIIWMVFGIFFFSFTIGSLASSLSGVSTKSTLLTKRLSLIDEFAKDCKVGKDLKNKIKDALRYNTSQDGFSWKNKEALFLELPLKLRYEVALSMHKQAATKILFFQKKDASFVTAIVPLLSPIRLNPGEYVYFKNDVSEEVYFLVKGKVSLIDNENKISFVHYLEGSYFGDIEIVLKKKREFSTLCVNPTNLLFLNIGGINIIQEEFRSVWEEFRKLAERRKTLQDIASKNAKIILKDRQDQKYDQMTHEQIKERYNDSICIEFNQLNFPNRAYSKKEIIVDEFCLNTSGFIKDIKKISQKVTRIGQKIRTIEKYVNFE